MASTDREERVEFLARIPLFRSLSRPERELLGQRLFRRTYAAGESVFLEGQECQGMFLISEGAVKIYKSSAAGREVLLTIERAPASIAEIPVFDGGPYPASASAIEPLTTYLIEKRDFQMFCRENPEIVLKFLAVIGRRLRTLVSLVHDLSFGSIRQRLARHLLEFQQQAGAATFVLPVTHQELALRLGTVREVVSRNLSRFQSQGLIRIDHHTVSILEPEGLEREGQTET